jgi:hypothetical protein
MQQLFDYTCAILHKKEKEIVMLRLKTIMIRDLTNAENDALEIAGNYLGEKTGHKTIRRLLSDYKDMVERDEDRQKAIIRIAERFKRVDHIKHELKRLKEELNKEFDRFLLEQAKEHLPE